ncbi:MAG: gliding motility lipoprotein GldK, partial [Alphaproteobacteria bacterium]|nr:gliding motility lipoprotein GldK [Alphaproteobacteria bacterium]
MNKFVIQFKNALLLTVALGAAVSCGRKGGGEDAGGDLTGVPGRESWIQTIPYGMVVCPSGTFHMG